MSTKGLCGRDTQKKQKDFRDLLNLHMTVTEQAITKNNWADRVYYYFDVFGGTGIYTIHNEECVNNGRKHRYTECNCQICISGSPIIFQQVAREHGIKFQARIYEENKKRYDKLASTIFLDNIEIVREKRLDLYTNGSYSNNCKFGLLYLDPPNTKITINYSFDLMEQSSILYPRVDLLMYLAGTTPKRYRESDKLPDRLGYINKKYWIVRDCHNNWQWTFLIGTNYDGWAKWKNRGFYSTNSSQGKIILDKLSLTTNEFEELYKKSNSGQYQQLSFL